MDDYNLFILSRVVHVIGVVLWIGGVAFVTTVLIPSLRRSVNPEKRFELFETLERRFALQAKAVTLLTGLSGLYMLAFLKAWNRYLQVSFWWLHLMTLVWLVFTIVLFVLEPLVLHRWFHQQAVRDPDRAFRLLQRMHNLLLTISLIAVAGAVAGVRGFHIIPGLP